MIIERFAPSPTGLLHLGHAYSAWLAWKAARDGNGRFLLRLEDLDQSRVRKEYVDAIKRDLTWLGLSWDGPILMQSDRQDAYLSALDRLNALGLTYPCLCTRRDILDAIAAPQEGAVGPDGPIYPGTCRDRDVGQTEAHAIRLNMGKTAEMLAGIKLSFEELGTSPEGKSGTIEVDPVQLCQSSGDIVLKRRDGAIAYHLAVVVDDTFQQVTHVTRGCDLFSATPIHRVLQTVLDLPVPAYRHHALVRDKAGKRLAKRDDARSIAAYREAGETPGSVLTIASDAAARPAA